MILSLISIYRTTTELTTTFATWIANLFGLGKGEKVVEYIVRGVCIFQSPQFGPLRLCHIPLLLSRLSFYCSHISNAQMQLTNPQIFFALNLIFNGIMWTLFTKALARGTSTTQVSILNTSSNFMITAVLGFLIFSESLPPLWFLGAALLVAGNVIIGRREEKDTLKRELDEEHGHGEEEGLLNGEEVELELDEDLEALERKRREREREDEDDVLQLDLRSGGSQEDLLDLTHR